MHAFKQTVEAYKQRFGSLSVRMLFRPPHEIEKIAEHIMIALKRDRALTDVEIGSLNTEDARSTVSQAVVGDRLPNAIFETMDPTGPIKLSAHQIFATRTAVVFAVPGAFTPSCHYLHIPGFVADYQKLRRLGADIVVCVSVNDVYVLHQWAIATDPRGQLLFLSDGNLEFTRALGMLLDASSFRFGKRTKRYGMIVMNGVVKALRVEPDPTKAEWSSSQSMIEAFRQIERPAGRVLAARK